MIKPYTSKEELKIINNSPFKECQRKQVNKFQQQKLNI